MWHMRNGIAFIRDCLNKTSIWIYFNADDSSLFLKINHHTIWKPIVYGGTKIIWSIQVIMYNKVYLFLNSWNITLRERVFLKTISLKCIWNNEGSGWMFDSKRFSFYPL